MDSDPESAECPLCLEVLEADDLSFYPCTCCYQICRFCWHRIRTDENGLCPACRKPYSENPAQYKPLTEEEIQRVKRERKLKESHKKPKITESRKHLANLRVVQRNLVFVNGLPARLADTDSLRSNDFFGKYGKIVKLVTSPAHNGQLNSICVYITYSRSEEALRAIQALHNYHVDSRAVKATLGTTKYCSRYLKGATCQKADCLYLHEPGDPLASFTKEQMQQGLHLDYERKLMEQFSSKNPTTASATPKPSKNLSNGHKNEASQRRKYPNQPTPLLPSNTIAMSSNGHSDLESGDENHHQPSNGYSADTFPSSTAVHVDSDSTSTSSQTSSDHDPQVLLSTNQAQNCQVSPSQRNWPDGRTCFYPTTDLAPCQTNTIKSISPSIDASLNVIRTSPKMTNNSSSNEFVLNCLTNATTMNNAMKPVDQMPEYKPFNTNTPSLHAMLFANLDNGHSNSVTNHRPLLNGLGHDVREVEKKLFETSFKQVDGSSFLPTQENDELGFDPCSLFISGLAPDLEDERRPSSSMISSRLQHSTIFPNYSSQPSLSATQSSTGQMNTNWFPQQQPQSYSAHYLDPQITLHTNGANIQKQTVGSITLQQQSQQLTQQRYPLPFNNGPSSRSTWNTTPQQPQTQYPPQINPVLGLYNQTQAQRLVPTQPSPSSQFSQSISNNHHKTTYSSNSTLSTNNVSNESLANTMYMDPAIISFGHKGDTLSSQWSSNTQSQGSSDLPSGTNLTTASRWPQSQSIQFTTHTLTNGIYAPYSATSSVEDGNRS